jgi:hypothetical protein
MAFTSKERRPKSDKEQQDAKRDRLEAALFLKASRRKSLIPSGGLHFPTPNERRWAEVLITNCSKLKMVWAGGLLLGLVDFEGVLCCPKSAGDCYAATCGLARTPLAQHAEMWSWKEAEAKPPKDQQSSGAAEMMSLSMPSAPLKKLSTASITCCKF